MANNPSQGNHFPHVLAPDEEYTRNIAQLDNLEANLGRFMQHVRSHNELQYRRRMLTQQVQNGQQAQSVWRTCTDSIS
jgi:hypothetical protein